MLLSKFFALRTRRSQDAHPRRAATSQRQATTSQGLANPEDDRRRVARPARRRLRRGGVGSAAGRAQCSASVCDTQKMLELPPAVLSLPHHRASACIRFGRLKRAPRVPASRSNNRPFGQDASFTFARARRRVKRTWDPPLIPNRSEVHTASHPGPVTQTCPGSGRKGAGIPSDPIGLVCPAEAVTGVQGR